MDRISYLSIRQRFLEYCFVYCRDKLRLKKAWATKEHEAAYAYDQMSYGWESDVEEFIITFCAYVIRGTKTEGVESYRNRLFEIIKAIGLQEILESVVESEKDEFYSDIQAALLPYSDGSTLGMKAL